MFVSVRSRTVTPFVSIRGQRRVQRQVFAAMLSKSASDDSADRDYKAQSQHRSPAESIYQKVEANKYHLELGQKVQQTRRHPTTQDSHPLQSSHGGHRDLTLCSQYISKR